MVGSWQLYVSYDQPYGDPPGHLCEMLHKLYIGRATKGENFTKTMKRERVNLKEDSHQKELRKRRRSPTRKTRRRRKRRRRSICDVTLYLRGHCTALCTNTLPHNTRLYS